MGYLYIIITVFMFSMVGTSVTLAKTWVSSDVIAWGRFAFGVLALLIYMLIRRKKISLRLTGWAVWIGVACKVINYLTENYAIANGYSFGNILVWPVQCVVVPIASVFLLREKISRIAVLGVGLCIAGVGVISYNGQSLSQLVTGEGLWFTLLFVIAGAGAAGFVMAQRVLLTKMDPCDLNLSMLLLGAVITGAALPFRGEFTGPFNWGALFGLCMLGVITGIAFTLSAQAMKTVPVFVVTVCQSMNVLLTLLWSVLFFHEPVTPWIIGGTVVFVIGMVLVNVKGRGEKKAEKESA